MKLYSTVYNRVNEERNKQANTVINWKMDQETTEKRSCIVSVKKFCEKKGREQRKWNIYIFFFFAPLYLHEYRVSIFVSKVSIHVARAIDHYNSSFIIFTPRPTLIGVLSWLDIFLEKRLVELEFASDANKNDWIGNIRALRSLCFDCQANYVSREIIKFLK